MQKALDDSLVDEAKIDPVVAVYVLNFKYVGGHNNPQGLEKKTQPSRMDESGRLDHLLCQEYSQW